MTSDRPRAFVHRPAQRWVALALGLGLAAACTADPGPSPPQSLSPEPSAPASSVAPSPTASALPPPPSVLPTPTITPSAPSGLAWTQVALPVGPAFTTAGVIDVALLDGLFLAVGAGWQEDERGVQVNVPLFWLSRDGRAWEAVLDETWSAGYIDAVTTWQGRFLAAGYVGDERASAAFWTSADGRSWQRLADQPVLEFFRGATDGRDIVSGGIAELQVVGAELIARGWLYCACERGVRDGIVEWRTTDGERWQRADLPPDQDAPTPLKAGDALLRIAPDRGSIERSTDGTTWQTAWAPAPTADGGATLGAQLFRLGSMPDGFLAVGASLDEDATQPLAVSSSDGIAWGASAGPGIDDVDGALLAFAAAGEGPIVAVGRIGDPAQPFAWLALPQSGAENAILERQ